jgi:ABC-type Na+ efflux pump permease subunit
MKILDIALKDLTRSFRSAIILLFMFGVPLLVTGMFYFMFGNIAGRDGFNLPQIQVIIANLDKGGPKMQAGAENVPGGRKADTLGELIVNILQSEELTELLAITQASDASAARAAVDSQQAQVAIIIPEDFSSQFADLYGQTNIEFYQDPTLTISPKIVKSIMNQFMDRLSAIKIAVNVTLDQLNPENYSLVGIVIQEYLDTSITQTEDLNAAILDIRRPDNTAARQEASDNLVAKMLGQIMGGMMIFYAFYTGMASAESLLREEEEGTLPRLFTTPTPQAYILAGKFLAVFMTVGVQVVVLLYAARLIFKVEWGELGPLALFVTGVVCSAATFGIFVNSMLKNTKQGGVIFGGVLTLTGMLGMIRVFAMNSPSADKLCNSVALLVPQGWATRALLQTMSGEPVASVFYTMLVLLAWSLVFFAIGVWRFNHRYV